MERASAAWALCALAAFAGTYLGFIQRDLLWSGVFIVGACAGYLWVLGRAMRGNWSNFKKF